MKVINIGLMLLVLWGIHVGVGFVNDTALKIAEAKQNTNKNKYLSAQKHKYFKTETVKKSKPIIRTVHVKQETDDTLCLAVNIYHEARNQGIDGMYAVAYVTLNRSLVSYYPNTVCGVVYQGQKDKKGNYYVNRCQFSWVCDRMGVPKIRNNELWELSKSVAKAVMTQANSTGGLHFNGATHYYNPYIVSPKWAKSDRMVRVAKINQHVFYTDILITGV